MIHAQVLLLYFADVVLLPGDCFLVTTSNINADEGEDSDTPCVTTLPSNYCLESTNLVVTAPSAGQVLSGESLMEALRSSLEAANVEVIDFKPARCMVSRLLLRM